MLGNKVALFAGIGRLGIPVARRLVEKNWLLAISYRGGRNSEATVKTLVDELGSDKIFGFNAQISDEHDARKFVEEAFKRYGRIDALINIASHFPEEEIWRRWETGRGVTDDDWKFYRSNFTPIRNVTLAVLERFNKDSEGELNIINFADSHILRYVERDVIDPYLEIGKSITDAEVGDIGSLGFRQLEKAGATKRDINPYVLSKRDIVYLTRRLAIDNQGGRVRVNAIAPGPMLPPPDMNAEEAQPFVDASILKRWGYEGPIVKAVEYLLDNSFVTGEIHRVDGGVDLFRAARQQGL